MGAMLIVCRHTPTFHLVARLILAKRDPNDAGNMGCDVRLLPVQDDLDAH